MVQGLFREVDNSPLIFWRIWFGLILFFEAVGALALGWVSDTFVETPFTFTFIGFECLRIFHGPAMYGWYGLMAAAALGIILGWRYRFSMILYSLLWTGSYLMQKSHYNNHYYLLMMLCWMMCFLPANAYFSLDVRRNPALKKLSCPSWCLNLIVAQLAIVYFYAAVAKLYPDWMAGRPLEIWFAAKANYPLIGPWLVREGVAPFFAWAGIIFDFLVIPALIWKRTRWAAVIASAFFHLFNSIVFQIGGFPYLMLGALVFFFPPEATRKRFFRKKEQVLSQTSQPHKWVIWGLGLYFFIQLLLPLRHHLFEGHPNWTEEGHRLAWRMMLRSKSGSLSFRIVDPVTGDSWQAQPTEFTSRKQAQRVAIRPDMLWQLVQEMKKHYEKEGFPQVEIYAQNRVSLNGHGFSYLIDPEVDLAKEEWQPLRHHPWILVY